MGVVVKICKWRLVRLVALLVDLLAVFLNVTTTLKSTKAKFLFISSQKTRIYESFGWIIASGAPLIRKNGKGIQVSFCRPQETHKSDSTSVHHHRDPNAVFIGLYWFPYSKSMIIGLLFVFCCFWVFTKFFDLLFSDISCKGWSSIVCLFFDFSLRSNVSFVFLINCVVIMFYN